MRIIYYSPHPTHDIVSEVGYATHQREVILALKREGHEVIPVIMGGTEKDNLNPVTNDAYNPPVHKRLLKKIMPSWIWTTMNNYKLILHDRKAGKILEENINLHKPDLIYERSEYLQDSGARMVKKYGIKYFLEVNAPFVEEMNEFEGFSLFHPRAHRIEAYKLKAADKVFCVSSALREFLIRRYACPLHKIIVQPNCINPVKYHSDPSVVADLRNRWLQEGGKIIGFVGSMFPYHGVDVLISAFAGTLKKHINTRLLIVGDGVVMGDLKRLTGELGIADSVIFTGKIGHEKVFNYIAAMDVCIMARSNWYGSPVKLFEYGLMRKPVIAPDTAPVTDVMEDGVDGLLISDDVRSLEKAIDRLLSDHGLAEKMALNFHEKVLLSYTWDKAAKTILKACE